MKNYQEKKQDLNQKEKPNKCEEKENFKEELAALKKENEEIIKELEDLKKKCEEEGKKSEDFKDKWVRSVAEFDNYKKRNANLYKEAKNDGKAEVILKVLSVGDNLERALEMELDDKTKDGLKLVLKSFKETLENSGVTEIVPEGAFDPTVAEAVMQVECEGESGNVKDVYQKGYELDGKIIRYAKVSVIK